MLAATNGSFGLHWNVKCSMNGNSLVQSEYVVPFITQAFFICRNSAKGSSSLYVY